MRRALVRCAAVAAVFAVAATQGAASAAPKTAKRKPPRAAPAATAEAAPPSDVPTGAVPITVVEVAGTQAYLQPGASAGVRRGGAVTINHREYTVVQATDSFAAIVIGENPPRERDKGYAIPIDAKMTLAVDLPRPTPLTAWTHAWTAPVPPSSSERPRFVPLGQSEHDRRWDVRLSASSGALLPLGARGSNLARAEIDARVHAEPFGAPVAFDVDVAIQRWFDVNLAAREGARARPLVYVRELSASYRAGGFFGALGRLRYAARTLGMLDGARAGAEVGEGFSIGAFGGLLPDPESGAPSHVANRFGVEAAYARPDFDLRPEAALVVNGSTFGGKLDERRLSGVANLYPGPTRLGGYFEVSAFDASNPWKTNPIELTAAGFDSSIRAGIFQLDGRFDLRRPERSLWLASYLPASWFCTTVPTAGAPSSAAEPCSGVATTRVSGLVDAGVEVDRVSLFVGGTRTGDLTDTAAPSTLGAFAMARVVRIARVLRVDASGNYSTATYLDMTSGSAGPGFTFFGDTLDVSAYYRLATLRYRSVPATLTEHAAGGAVVVLPSPELLLAAQGEAIAGDDVKALMLFGTVTWRPSL